MSEYEVNTFGVNELTEEQIDGFKETFKLIDKKSDGKLSASELQTLFAGMGEEYTEQDIQEMLNEISADGSPSIDFNEFLSLMAQRTFQAETDEEIIEAFKVFDSDGSGYISTAELEQMMMTFGQQFSLEETAQVLQEADMDGDGMVDYVEFVKIINRW